MEKSDNALDKRMSEGVNQKIAQKIKEHSPNLLTGGPKKLDAITNNKIELLHNPNHKAKAKADNARKQNISKHKPTRFTKSKSFSQRWQ